jgi:hypothetical protein
MMLQRMAGVLVLALLASGCLRSTTVISLKPDGSGTVVQETGVSPQALAMLQGFAGAANEGGKSTPPQLFGEDQAKKAAATMGVQFVSGEPFKTAEMEGYRARFSFDDIRKVRMKMNQDPTKGVTATETASASDSPFSFEFERRGAASVLTIVMPDKSPADAGLNPMSGLGMGADKSNPQSNQQAIQMMKAMMAGMFVDITLNVDGRIIKTNAPFVKGSDVTLLQLDFDKLLADEASLMKLQGATDIKSLASVPGLKVIPEPRVTVEFGK